MTDKIKSHEIQPLEQLEHYFPKQIQQLHCKIKQGGSISDISKELKIDSGWLVEMLGDFKNKKTIIEKGGIQAGKVASEYYWGVPRIDDQFALVKWNHEYLLYRQREGKIIFTNIPIDKIKLIETSKIELHALADDINQTLSA